MGLTIILGLIAVFVVLFALMGFKIVQQSETMVIERLGKYNRTLGAGINIIWPIIDKPRDIMWRYVKESPEGRPFILKMGTTRIDLRENVYDFPKQNVITKDNVVTEINAILYFQVIDPVKAIYEISNLPDAIEKLTQTTLRNVIGEMELDTTLTSRDTINSKLRAVLDEASHKWGVKVNRVELQDINPPIHIREAMEKQMQAERSKRASILEAEGSKASQILISEGMKTAEINKAEGDKQALILRAEGEAKSIIWKAQGEADAFQSITQAVASMNADPVKYLLAIRYIDTLKEMVSGKDNKVIYMPFEASNVLGSIGGIKELLNGSKS